MYKLLLCWRYLLTRYLALICIISVMLGVATLIVVNSVMSGFSTKLRDRLHGLLSDVVIESISFEGLPDPDEKMERIRQSPIGDKIAAMTPAIEVFAILQFQIDNGEPIIKPIHLIGIDIDTRKQISGFSEYLMDPRNRANPSFNLSAEAAQRYRDEHPPTMMPTVLAPDAPPTSPWIREDSFSLPRGIIVGHAIGSFRDPKTPPGEPARTIYMLKPGDTVTLLTASVTTPIPGGATSVQPVRITCAVSDYIKTEMSEYDSNYAYVPLDYLQECRKMNLRNDHRVTSIQIQLKDFNDAPAVVAELKHLFPDRNFLVQTWEDKQGPLLAAISIEKGILNILLFLIIAVAGFGILAIFSMIVAEKTRDIGILKALGASNAGVMKIFLGYGLLLGLVGAGLGTILGLVLTDKINEIEHFLTYLTGQEIFDRKVYYFDKIPTDIQTMSVVLVNLGSVIIAVLFSVLPAMRAAMLHPVRALRYE